MPTLKLAYMDRWVREQGSAVDWGTKELVPFPVLAQDEPNKIVNYWTGAQVTRMFSALKIGADLLWPEVANQILWDFLSGIHTIPEFDEDDSGCINYLPYAPFVSYSPQNPYSQPDFVPDDYLIPPFFVNSGFDYPSEFGYKSTDVFVNGASINIDPIDLLTLNLPQIRLRVYGTGQIELDLLAVTLGSQVVIKVGSPPNIFDIIVDGFTEDVTIIDLNVDSLSVPPETDIVYSEEINIEAEIGVATDVYIVFIPNVDDSLIPLRYGGGIRQIGLCGLEMSGEVGIVEDIKFNTENCTFEKMVGGEWEAIVGGSEWLACVEALMATQEEITAGVVDAAEIISSRFLAGIAGNVQAGVTINPDGTRELSDDTLPPDDPATDYDDTLAAQMGGSIAVAKGLELLFDKLDSYYGATNGTPITAESAAQFGIKVYFPNDGAIMDTAITNYYVYRATNGQLAFNTSAAFELYLFCNGANEQGFNRWLVDLSGFAAQKQVIMSGIVTGLSDEFFTDYFGIGAQAPALNYVDAVCVKSPPEIINIVTTGTNYTTLTQWKVGHRLKITVQNKWTDPAGIQRDFWYYRTAGGVVSNAIASTTITVGVAVVKPSTTQVPYNSTGAYVFTVETTLGSAMVINVGAGGVLNAPLTGGPLIVTIEDLGQIS